MILIADSGSTKTDWRLIDNQLVTSFQTIGLNPFHTKESLIKNTIESLNISDLKGEIYFYGSGCANEKINQKIYHALQSIFPHSHAEVHSDILGAARGLCNQNKGIVNILGTGAATALYDGHSITETGTSLGYILADDGSGANLGKELIRAYFFNELSDDLRRDFSDTYALDRAQLLENVYQKPFANRYLANFSKFLYKHKDAQEIQNIINKCFFNFFEFQITKMKDFNKYDLYFSGSVAYYFQDHLKKTASIYNLKVATIEKSPIQGLINYHQGNF